jgi:Xaa-Pro dipeptidase
MRVNQMDALFLTGGTSMIYFTNVRWGGGERLFTVVIPVDGEPFVVCPAFEEDRAREQLALGPLGGTEVRTWEEHESPYQRVAEGLRDRGMVAWGLRRRCSSGSAMASPRPLQPWKL